VAASLRRNEVGLSATVVLAVVAVAVAVLALGVALTRSSTTRIVVGPFPTPTTLEPTCSFPGDLTAALASARSIGKAAYASEPLAVSHNGTYQLVFGPLSVADVQGLRRIASGAGWSAHLDARFSADPLVGSYATYRENGRTYIRVPMTVTDFKAECSALQFVIQY
jgi:hypothetical protein